GALPHYIDLLHHLFGDIARLNSCRGSVGGDHAGGEQPDDVVLVAGAFRSAGYFNISATWSARHSAGERWETVGAQRSLTITADGGLWLSRDDGAPEKLPVPAQQEVLWAGAHNGGFGFGNADRGLAAMITDIAAHLSQGRPSRCASFADGQKSAELIAFIRAADTARPVGGGA